mgnify:FL=1
MTADQLILSAIALSHGQARWLLKHFNLSSGETDQAFDALLKSLRRDGVPFGPDELGGGAGNNVIYKFEHLMELALAMTLRTQGIISRDIVRLIPDHRKKLRGFFIKAYLERDTGLGKPMQLQVSDPVAEPQKAIKPNPDPNEIIQVRGTYLDLAIVYLPGGSLHTFRFDLLGSIDAVKAFMQGHQNLYPRPPIPLSDIACDIVRLAQGNIPTIRRGRR